ncbi:hypothetical protein Mapa_016154 [Marchantia paleacea]|nr:hypothetical protein Mapa_016154 [Marchantia paleacea]
MKSQSSRGWSDGRTEGSIVVVAIGCRSRSSLLPLEMRDPEGVVVHETRNLCVFPVDLSPAAVKLADMSQPVP